MTPSTLPSGQQAGCEIIPSTALATSLFISYAHADNAFVGALEERLAAKGVRDFWRDAHDLGAGRFEEQIDLAIARQSTFLLVLSAAAIESDWVELEASKAMDVEQDHGGRLLCPIAIDLTPAELLGRVKAKWGGVLALRLRKYHVLDFTRWRDAAQLDAAVDKLLKALGRSQDAPARPTPQTTKQQRLLHEHLEREARRYAAARLPLPDRQGTPVPLPIEAIRIDLPLQLTYAHGFPAQDADSADVEVVHRRTRQSYSVPAAFDGNVHSMISAPARSSKQRIAELLSAVPRLVLVGDPGCGKTTLLSYLAYTYAFRRLPANLQEPFDAIRKFSLSRESLPDRPWIPITLFCRDLTASKADEDLGGLIRDQLRRLGEDKQKSKALADLLIERLEAGEALLLIDGLDEMPANARGRLAQLLAAQADLPVIVTSRAVGFHSVAEVLSVSLDHLNVLPLGAEEKEQFVRAWAHALGEQNPAIDPARVVETLLPRVNRDRGTNRLCDSVLFITLFAQMSVLDSLPRHRRDVYRRTVEVMVERQRESDSPPLSINEIWPCLEWLAYRMRDADTQSWPDHQAAATIGELYRGPLRDSEFRRREPGQLIDDLLQKLEILNIAGPAIDEQGFERRMLQFFHPSFQEYFAAQALLHGRGAEDGKGVIDHLRKHVRDFSIEERKIESLRDGAESEPVAAGQWQEVVRMAILELKQDADGDSADDAMLMLLSLINANPKEGRALIVFALQCLADEPDVTDATRDAIFDTATDFLSPLDGFNNTPNTLMDDALRVVMQSLFGGACLRRFFETYMRDHGVRRERIGNVLLNLYRQLPSYQEASQDLSLFVRQLLERLRSHADVDRADAALQLTEVFYTDRSRASSKVDALPPDVVRETAAALVAAMEADATRDGALSDAASWALAWLMNVGPHRSRTIRLTEGERAALLRIAHSPQVDADTRTRCIQLLASDSESELLFSQVAWLPAWAKIADGNLTALPPRSLPEPVLDPAPLLPLLAVPSSTSATRAARAIGRLNCFVPELVDLLLKSFQDSTVPADHRDEALFYLTCIGGDRITDALLAGAAAERLDTDKYRFPERCVLGLIGLERPEVLRQYMSLGAGHNDFKNACARALGEPATAPATMGKATFLDVLIRSGNTPIHLVRCKDSAGRDCHFFIFCSMGRAQDLSKAFKQGSLNLTDYGEIVGSGFGREPSPELRKTLRERYDFDSEGM